MAKELITSNKCYRKERKTENATQLHMSKKKKRKEKSAHSDLTFSRQKAIGIHLCRALVVDPTNKIRGYNKDMLTGKL